VSHGSCSHFLALGRHTSPASEKPLITLSQLQQINGNPILVLINNSCSNSLDEKKWGQITTFSFFYKLVAMSIRGWLLALKHIEAPKILSWKISRSGICMEFFKLGTWCKYFVIYVVVIEKVKCYLYLVTKKWTKGEISNLAKFMPKHNQPIWPHLKDENFNVNFQT
jgi:hypothetical protein